MTAGLPWAAGFTAATALAAVLTTRLIGWAEARGVVDHPNDRSSHTRVTPRAGGLAIVAVTTLAAAAACLLDPPAVGRIAGAVMPALFVAVVSWIDDLRSLPNRIRFAAHLAAAVAATAVLGPIRTVDLGPLGSLDLDPVAWPLTLLWIVGLTNAFNFMDGIDGIAGLTALAAGGGLAAAARLLGDPPVAALALGLAAGSAGFLTRNWPPARIFMGDVGSAFCGFLLAVLPLAMSPAAVARAVPVAVLAMWPFIFDSAFTLCRRLRRRENVFQAHRSHLYQRLVIAGWSHAATSAVYGCLAALGAAIAVLPLAAPAIAPATATLALTLLAASAVLLVALTWCTERCRSSTTGS